MSTNERIFESNKRFEDLKNATLLKYLDAINLDEESMDLCDKIIYYFCKGDLDNEFYSSLLNDLNDDERKNILKLVHEYIGLCFYDGKSEYWIDSVEGIPLKDAQFICLKILDNINFLVRIAISGGKPALEFLKIFSDKEYYSDSSVIEYLRNSFGYDNVLENIILEMSKDDSSYNVFDDNQKAVLCGSPQGVLFFEDENEVKYSNPALLATRINNILDGDEDDLYSYGDFSDVINLLYLDYAKQRFKVSIFFEFNSFIFFIMCYNTYIFCDDLEVLVKYFIIRESMVGENRYKNFMNLSNEQLGNSVIDIESIRLLMK